MRVPITLADIESGRFTKIAKQLRKHWPGQSLTLMQAQAHLAVLLGYRDAHELRQLAPSNPDLAMTQRLSGQHLAVLDAIRPPSSADGSNIIRDIKAACGKSGRHDEGLAEAPDGLRPAGQCQSVNTLHRPSSLLSGLIRDISEEWGSMSRADMCAAMTLNAVRRLRLPLPQAAELAQWLGLRDLAVDASTLEGQMERREREQPRSDKKLIILDEAGYLVAGNWYKHNPDLMRLGAPPVSFGVKPDGRVFRWDELLRWVKVLPEAIYDADAAAETRALLHSDLLALAESDVIEAATAGLVAYSGHVISPLYPESRPPFSKTSEYPVEDDPWKRLYGENLVTLGYVIGCSAIDGVLPAVYPTKEAAGMAMADLLMGRALPDAPPPAASASIRARGSYLPGVVDLADGGGLAGQMFREDGRTYVRLVPWLKADVVPQWLLQEPRTAPASSIRDLRAAIAACAMHRADAVEPSATPKWAHDLQKSIAGWRNYAVKHARAMLTRTSDMRSSLERLDASVDWTALDRAAESALAEHGSTAEDDANGELEVRLDEVQRIRDAGAELKRRNPSIPGSEAALGYAAHRMDHGELGYSRDFYGLGRHDDPEPLWLTRLYGVFLMTTQTPTRRLDHGDEDYIDVVMARTLLRPEEAAAFMAKVGQLDALFSAAFVHRGRLEAAKRWRAETGTRRVLARKLGFLTVGDEVAQENPNLAYTDKAMRAWRWRSGTVQATQTLSDFAP